MPRLQILHHKSYHPYLEKNKQRVREDEAKAAAEELAIEQARIEGASAARLDELRRRAGSPSFQPPVQGSDDEAGELPSTSSAKDKGGDSLIERHKRDKARQQKREKKQKERLDFDFPSETARRDEKKRKREEERSGEGRGNERGREDIWLDGSGEGEALGEGSGHINLFADLEKRENEKPRQSLEELAKKKKDKYADPFTMYLERPEKETKPWYSDKDLRRYEDKETGEEAEERRARDARKDIRSKNRHDPLTQITTLLSKHPSSSFALPKHPRANGHQVANGKNGSEGTGGDARESRVNREVSERQRALDLIAKTTREKERKKLGNRWDDTPSTHKGGRSWAEDFEREKDKAGMRFYGNGVDHRRPEISPRDRIRAWDGRQTTGRSWEV